MEDGKIKLIDAEIKWCEEHEPTKRSGIDKRSFIKGLQQAKRLIRSAAASDHLIGYLPYDRTKKG